MRSSQHINDTHKQIWWIIQRSWIHLLPHCRFHWYNEEVPPVLINIIVYTLSYFHSRHQPSQWLCSSPRYQTKLLSKLIHIFCCLFLPVLMIIYEGVFISVYHSDFIAGFIANLCFCKCLCNIYYELSLQCVGVLITRYYKILCVLNIINVYRSALSMITVMDGHKTVYHVPLADVKAPSHLKSMFPDVTWVRQSPALCVGYLSSDEKRNFFTSSRFQAQIIMRQPLLLLYIKYFSSNFKILAKRNI